MAPHLQVGPCGAAPCPLALPRAQAGGLSTALACPMAMAVRPSALVSWPLRPLPSSTLPAYSGTPQNPRPIIFRAWGLPSASPRLKLEAAGGFRTCCGDIWGDRGTNMPQNPPQATLVFPRGSSPRSGSASLPQQNKFCWAIKRRRERGRPGATAGIHARALAGCHRLTCQGKQCYLPRNHDTRNTTTAPRPQTRGTGRQIPKRSWGLGSIPRVAVANGGAWQRHGCSPGRADIAQMPFCFPELPHVLRLVINFKTKRREVSWNQRGRWGCFLGKQKQRGGVARPGGRWRSSPLMGDTTLGAALGYPNPNPGQSHRPVSHTTVTVPVCASLALPRRDGGTGWAPGRGHR